MALEKEVKLSDLLKILENIEVMFEEALDYIANMAKDIGDIKSEVQIIRVK